MRWVYLFLCFFALGYVLLKKRRVDFFSVSIVSTIVYYYPAFWGELYNNSTGLFYPIISEVYLCLIAHISVLLFFVLLFDHMKQGKLEIGNIEFVHTEDNNDCYTNLVILFVALVGIALMVITIFTYGEMTGSEKTTLLANANRITEYYKYISLFVFVYAFSFTKEESYISILRIVSLIMIGYTFILGHRSFVVIGIIAILSNALMKVNQKVRLITYVRQYRKVVILGIIAAVFFLFVKNIMAALLNGDYDLVISRLTDVDYYRKSFFNSEANSILDNLQLSCENNLQFSFIDYLGSLFSLIPFLGGRITSALNVKYFEDILNVSFNDKLSMGIGLGSTYLGEAYSIGGVFTLVIALVLTFYFVAFVQVKKRSTQSRMIYTWLTIILVYFAFYIHRNSLIFLLVAARAYLYIVFLAYLIKLFLRKKQKKMWLIK